MSPFESDKKALNGTAPQGPQVPEAMPTANRPDPVIISGGMGVHVSCWQMARIVALMDGLGVVSGTALDIVHARILQLGDPGGHTRRAFAELSKRQSTLAEPLKRLIDNYYIEGGKPADKPYKPVPTWKLNRIKDFSDGTAALPPQVSEAMPTTGLSSFWEWERDTQALTIAANFAEVWLAKEGHNGLVGINFLRKLERPLPWALYGAMLAGVDYVVVGAGSPPELPGMIARLSCHEPASLPLKVHGTRSGSGEFFVLIRPDTLVGPQSGELKRPRFLAIVSSFALARALASNPATRPYGFVVEGPEAGGHNAPPAKMHFNDQGQQVLKYTEHDRADIGAIYKLGLPFWLAGSYASPEFLREALDKGAAGIQIGTAAALSGQSGMAPNLRAQALRMAARNELVVTDTMISPTGFPFKVAQIPGTISDKAVYQGRKRVCDIRLLQANYVTPEGDLGYRCPAEPVEDFTSKGGRLQNTAGRVCLCNGLLATAGFAQIRAGGYVEPPIVTLGEDFHAVRELLALSPPGQETYTIGKLILFLRGRDRN
ncbi:MAG: nitronate monooxygenase [Elusimicrobia bacterium]|nr:nitronate monooxygenase [Elusimicrobiota bacterium]